MADWPQKNAIHMRISRELLLDYGMVEPTAEEQAERDETTRTWKARSAAAQLRKGEILAKLHEVALTEPLGSIVKHHWPDDEDRHYCRGCDMGCSCEAAEWPCSTIRLVLDLEGVDTTDMDLIEWRGDL